MKTFRLSLSSPTSTSALSLRTALSALLLALAVSTATAAEVRRFGDLNVVTVAEGLDQPWALAFLPDGRMLVTEKRGRMRIVGADGRVGEPLAGLPPVDAGGQCGLLDVVVAPDFATSRRIYFTFAEAATGGGSGNGTAVATARLDGQTLADVRTIFSQRPKVASRNHCGSRIVFDRAGHLLVGLGDRFSAKDEAQNPANHIGKVVRIDRDGRAPADNPLQGRPGAAAEVYSLGHRNIQGAALHPTSGRLWAVEHGPQGGDEVNVVAPGRNYGWPRVTYGRNYGTGTAIGVEGPVAGYEQPVWHVVPTSLAPSGMAFVTGNRYPGWENSVVFGTLRGQVLVRLALDGERVVAEERLLQGLGERLRDVRLGPDGWLWLVTDSGRVLRVERATDG